METLSLIALAVSAATLVVTILIAIRLKTVHYLLQQPVVKKMSPQLRLKPVKLDDAMNRNRDRQAPGGGRPEGERREGGRPEGREGRDGRRDGRDGRREGRPEGERREGGRPEGREGREGRPEGDRRERREGGRPEGERREGRPEGRDGRRDGGRPEGERREGGRPEAERREGRPEGERRERRDGDRPERREGGRPENREARPPREFSDAPRVEAPVVESRPAAEAPAGLPPRRPLNTFSETPVARSDSSSSALSANDPVDATFVGSGDDVQHGRRTQLKKKPRFDIEEEPATPAV
jgi:hypothetical protein